MARLRVLGYRLAGGANIHPKCLIEAGVRIDRPWLLSLGARSVVQQGAWLSVTHDGACLVIGEHGFVGRHVVIEVSLAVTIGRGALIAPNVYITDHNHGLNVGVAMFEQPCKATPVVIGDDVWIGANCVILPGVTIGSGAVVAAGAVVNRDVPANAIVAGVPARVVKMRCG